jgi:hypothetical protein
MKAYVIDATAQTVEEATVENGLDGVRRLIGFDTVDSDEIDDNGDRLFFDERCHLRAEPGAPKFKVDNLAPVAGRGVVVRAGEGGSQLGDARVGLDALRKRVTFL